MIDAMSFALMIGVLLAALMKRSEMALWLLLISGLGAIVAVSNSSPDAAITFFCGANLILMMASFANWRKTRLNLPFLIGILASLDVVAGFIHYLHLLNVGSTSYVIGLIAGTIGYIQLILVCSMEDSKGVMNDILNDSGHLLHSVLHLGSDHHHSGHSK
tara:strand:- start:10321 stop:10800 length:480 start_codon:yes stop_codon:yes gene_type:complete